MTAGYLIRSLWGVFGVGNCGVIWDVWCQDCLEGRSVSIGVI